MNMTEDVHAQALLGEIRKATNADEPRSRRRLGLVVTGHIATSATPGRVSRTGVDRHTSLRRSGGASRPRLTSHLQRLAVTALIVHLGNHQRQIVARKTFPTSISDVGWSGNIEGR